jgi:uncharacterized protein
MAEIIELKTIAPRRACPMCDKPESPDFRPFCSKRCSDLDLGKWLKEDYRIASTEDANLDAEPPEDEY